MRFEEIAKRVKSASVKTASLSSDIKKNILYTIAEALQKNSKIIFKANEKDLNENKDKVSQSVYNRLKLDENKMRDMISGIKDVAELEDIIGKVLLKRELDEGLVLKKITCPIGVLGIIFEARPDVIAQIISLAVKSGNAVILKGGKESLNTNKEIFNVIKTALKQFNEYPDDAIVQIFTHDDVNEMLKCSKYIDLIIPRGGNKLVKFIKENTQIPVLGHEAGICHIFLDKTADFDLAVTIITDSKTQHPSACNSVETLLIHKDFENSDKLLKALEINGITLDHKPEQWDYEHGDKTLAYKYVEDMNEAINHINTYGSGHTDCIITDDNNNAELFKKQVDSAGVYHNVSTRFADGFRYGFGAEVGISTNKTHARGPVGIDGLTIYKYELEGNGQTVKEYVTGEKQFHHKDLI